MTSRRRLRGTTSLKRRTTAREPEPIRPEDYATTAKPIGVCRACHHHTSAFCGRCTAMVPGVERLLTYCGCDCREHLTRKDAVADKTDGPLPWWFLSKLSWRRRIGTWLHWLADRVSPEDSFRASHLRLHFEEGVGAVVDESPGTPLWFRACDYERAHRG